MTKVTAAITTSVDGYYSGPEDRPGQGLGIGGERLHYWLFGGHWSYDEEPGEATADDQGWLEEAMENVGAVVAGRWTYEAADHWSDSNPFGLPFFIVTHHPDGGLADGMEFASGLEDAVEAAKSAASGKDVYVMGGGDVIRQALRAGLVDELTIIIAPVTLGGGKRLFDGFEGSLELEHIGVRQSSLATFVDYRVVGWPQAVGG
jgi:dihydrofolate reductase